MADWLLPLDRSTIGRAKSAVPLRHQGLSADVLDAIEATYQAWGIDARFRVADVPGLGNIHQRLRAMGYAPDQPTQVLVGSVSALLALPVDAAATVDTNPSARWAAVYTAPGFDAVDGAHRVQALSRSPHTVYAAVHRDGHALAAGTASLSQGWASIHGMRTVPTARGQGLACQILQGLAGVAAQRGLERVFLQVEEKNTAALALYARAGFKAVWRYHYWRKL
ncbi:MAG: GNAT family N-acetyltransferase [Burkholderiales bacterium PBB3]|nr:MAG: GNAT family N-acetyltransferase [Burkholderiales bacterium PBB3]